jgi:hypothetical protein
MPFVKESRNLLLVRPASLPAETQEQERFLFSLLYALKQGIEREFNVEPGELAAELIGEGEQRRLLFFETAEGGAGAAERLLREADGFARVAVRMLGISHFTAEGEDERPESCSAACYECLLAYENQPFHHQINRHTVADLMVSLVNARTEIAGNDEGRDNHYQRLLGELDPGSMLEREFLAFLHAGGYRLPDRAQTRPASDVASQPDFFYERSHACIFVDGPQHGQEAVRLRDTAAREALADRGFQVVVIQPPPFEPQVARHASVFSAG